MQVGSWFSAPGAATQGPAAAAEPELEPEAAGGDGVGKYLSRVLTGAGAQKQPSRGTQGSRWTEQDQEQGAPAQPPPAKKTKATPAAFANFDAW